MYFLFPFLLSCSTTPTLLSISCSTQQTVSPSVTKSYVRFVTSVRRYKVRRLICLTNQALDQFLEGILNRTERVIRLGSQSKSSLLEPFLVSNTKDNIYNQRRSYAETNFFFHSSHMKTLSRGNEHSPAECRSTRSTTTFCRAAYY